MCLLQAELRRVVSHLREERQEGAMRPASDFGHVTSKLTLKQERCPKCYALLFRADAEGAIEIKCRKCSYIVKCELRRRT